MDKRLKCLSLCLLDALEDENLITVTKLLDKYLANPNVIPIKGGISPMHFACGMNNIEVAERAVEKFLDCKGDPNVETEDNVTPVHVAAMYGRANIVKLLLDFGGVIDVCDVENKTPIDYAIEENHYDVIDVFKSHIFEKKIEKKPIELTAASAPLTNNQHNQLHTTHNMQVQMCTPNKMNINHNYNVISPHYIIITHGSNQEVSPSHENLSKGNQISQVCDLFNLQEETFENFAKKHNSLNDSRSERWRKKFFQRERNRKSIIQGYGDIESLINRFNNDQVFPIDLLTKDKCEKDKDTKFSILENGESPTCNLLKSSNLIIPDIIISEDIDIAIEPQKCSSTQTAPETSAENFIRSPSREKKYCLTKIYAHSDQEYDIEFYEKKVLPNPYLCHGSENRYSTDNDNDTDSGNETAFLGEPSGSVTKTSKKLYAKSLINFCGDSAAATSLDCEKNNSLELEISVELRKTIRNIEHFKKIPHLFKLVSECWMCFANKRDEIRGENARQSFVYILIDPRMSQNLPIEKDNMSEFEVWKQFVKSIFYVGTGKEGRPYSYLYNAIKKYSEARELCSKIKDVGVLRFGSHSQNEQCGEEKRKLKRIMRIWEESKGVVCLHVFHFVLPIEASTREAAMKDALGLKNIKSGSYYGTTKTWPMRSKKQMGIALLYKAMKTYLAEGESQIAPYALK